MHRRAKVMLPRCWHSKRCQSRVFLFISCLKYENRVHRRSLQDLLKTNLNGKITYVSQAYSDPLFQSENANAAEAIDYFNHFHHTISIATYSTAYRIFQKSVGLIPFCMPQKSIHHVARSQHLLCIMVLYDLQIAKNLCI